MNTTNQLPATYSKDNSNTGVGGAFANPTVPNVSSPNRNNRKEKKTILGVDIRVMMTVLGLVLFFVVAMSGVLISQKQRLDKDVTAPNAPVSEPAANVEKPKTCTLTFTVGSDTELACNEICKPNGTPCAGLTCIDVAANSAPIELSSLSFGSGSIQTHSVYTDPADGVMKQAVWRGDQGWIADMDGNALSGPYALADQTFGSGKMQTQSVYTDPADGVMKQAVWRGDQGWIVDMSGNALVGPIALSSLSFGSGSMQTQSVYTDPSDGVMKQAIWRGDQGWIADMSGNVLGGPYALADQTFGSGEMQSQTVYTDPADGVMKQAVWRGDQGWIVDMSGNILPGPSEYRCRLASNPTSETCSTIITPTPTKPVTITTTPTPTPSPTTPPTPTPGGPTVTPTPSPTTPPTPTPGGPTATPTPGGPTATPTPVDPTATPTPTPAPGQCGSTDCSTDADCDGTLVCVNSNTGTNYCAMPEYQDTCAASPSGSTCCTAPNTCGTPDCGSDADCAGTLICVTADNGTNFCTMPEHESSCTSNPSTTTCCVAPTLPPGVTINPTQPPPVYVPGQPPYVPPPPSYTVVTTLRCGDSCSTNDQCANISHICFEGRCRLDTNPRDEFCRTPQGTTTTVVQSIPVREVVVLPEQLPESGFEDWGTYLKVGLGALGAGVLLLLFL